MNDLHLKQVMLWIVVKSRVKCKQMIGHLSVCNSDSVSVS